MTASLTSKRCILYIYSTNIGTEYFKNGIYSPFFSSSKFSLFHNSNIFGSCIIHILYTGCAKIKKKIIPAPKGLITKLNLGVFSDFIWNVFHSDCVEWNISDSDADWNIMTIASYVYVDIVITSKA